MTGGKLLIKNPDLEISRIRSGRLNYISDRHVIWRAIRIPNNNNTTRQLSFLLHGMYLDTAISDNVMVGRVIRLVGF